MRGALLPPHFTDAEADPAEASPPSEPQAEFAVLMNAVCVETVGMGQDRQNPTTSLKLEKADGAAYVVASGWAESCSYHVLLL